ncbi:MAG: hypothetical protein A2Y33_04490 [Spirochaetes bacterium GWF1_51_8]|nr:MAG: hypothetical protein A2Y33_04490 [Spirochaetes bacterium GWF1_51_8]
MQEEIIMNKMPMSGGEIEKLEREKSKIRMMFIIYAVLSVIFSGAIVFALIYGIFMLAIMSALPIIAYAIISIIFSFKYSRMKKDLAEQMMYSETGKLDDIFISYKGPSYRFLMNGKWRRGFREMVDELKKGDRIELYLACNSRVPVGFKKVS